jgi:hypothetical protein
MIFDITMQIKHVLMAVDNTGRWGVNSRNCSNFRLHLGQLRSLDQAQVGHATVSGSLYVGLKLQNLRIVHSYYQLADILMRDRTFPAVFIK